MRSGLPILPGWGSFSHEMIDFDANATTALLPEVLDGMLPWLGGGYSNPSGAYRSAKKARIAIDAARDEVAQWLGADPAEVVFTGCGTESVNTALRSLHQVCGPGAVVVSAIEHSAVLRCAESLGRELRLLPVLADGRVDLDAMERLLEGAAMVSVMAANNETGVVQPLAEIIRLAHARGIPVHSDAVQAAGKMPLDFRGLGLDLLSVSAHKFHGPKGVGGLLVRKGLQFHPWLLGGGQEAGRRSGTENTPGIVGMGIAARAARDWLASDGPAILKAIRDGFEQQVLENVSGCRRNGNPGLRLPNTSHLSFDGCDAAGLLILLDDAGIACSAGSACMTGKSKPSHVQLAMGIPEAIAKSSLRFSLSRLNTKADAMAAARAVVLAVEKLRRIQGRGVGPVAVYS